MDDLISRQQAINTMQMLIDSLDKESLAYKSLSVAFDRCIIELKRMPSAQPEPCEDAVSREAVSEWLKQYGQDVLHGKYKFSLMYIWKNLMNLPSAQTERDIPKRVLWTGWKGCRDTRYKCPNCQKPVRNDDIYCHRCGQRLMFPHISFTDYIPGEKQEIIVRWDDE